MKKIITVILVLCMLLSLTACVAGGGDDNTESTNQDTSTDNNQGNEGENGNKDTETSTDTDNSQGNEGGSNNQGAETNTDTDNNQGNEGGSNATDNKIDPTRITDMIDFREGKALVRYGEISSSEYQTVYCIDKAGTILFTLNGINVASGISGFYNGLTTLQVHENGKISTILCNDKGEIIKPEDLGATSFLIEPNSTKSQTIPLFVDGYIFVEKTETTFTSSTTKAAVLNSDLEIIVDYSEELYNLYEQFICCSYYNGYLYDMWHNEVTSVLDLKTGKTVEDLASLAASIEREYESDLWLKDNYCYFDLITGEKKVDLSKYSETIATTYDFECGLAPVLFYSGDKYFFAIVKEDGSFCFDPAEIGGSSPTVKYDNGKFVVFSSIGSNYHIETFDASGKLGELNMEMSGFYFSISISDDVVIFWDVGASKYSVYTLNLNPLFQ